MDNNKTRSGKENSWGDKRKPPPGSIDVEGKNYSELITTDDLYGFIQETQGKRYVLLGESTHGTHEYYKWRAEISKRLIHNEKFSYIAVEGDWPECYKVNRYVKGYPNSGKSALEVLNSFNRWPTWLYANFEMLEFIEWLRAYNEELPPEKKAGFYGLDVYSLWDSLEAIVHFLKKIDSKAVDTVMKAYLCFEPYHGKEEEYAAVSAFAPDSCKDEVVKMLLDLYLRKKDYQKDSVKNFESEELFFNIEQNALIVKDAEEYYRTMIYGGPHSWNVRDSHMTETLERLMRFYGKKSRGIVWAHNNHIGDAEFTDMKDAGMTNIGQLLRKKHGKEEVLITGFGTYSGSVLASYAWGGPVEQMMMLQPKKGGWEELMHRSGKGDKIFIFKDKGLGKEFSKWRSQRVIGVVYDPLREAGNYTITLLPKSYDAFIFIEKTRALFPIDTTFTRYEELPETYPTAI